MSLYNMLFKTEPTAAIALQMLDIAPAAVPRIRDAYFTWADDAETDPVIVIHTRTGGGNREHYDAPNDENLDGPWNSDLRELDGYRSDRDCEHDSTYADFVFDVPATERDEVIRFLKEVGKPLTAAQKFEAAMDALKKT